MYGNSNAHWIARLGSSTLTLRCAYRILPYPGFPVFIRSTLPMGWNPQRKHLQERVSYFADIYRLASSEHYVKNKVVF